MKRKLGILAALAALGGALYVAGSVRAQQQAPVAAQAYQATRPPLQTRIAVVNISQVIKNYRKYQSFQEELKQQSKTAQQAVDACKAQAMAEQKEMEQPTVTPERRDQLERDMKRLQRQAQDQIEDARMKMGKREFDELVKIYKDIKDAVDAYARAYALELVLQYQEAQGADEYSPPFFQQKLANRACIPIYADPRMDITQNITDMLNQKLASLSAQPARGN